MKHKYNTVWTWHWVVPSRGVNLGYSVVWWPKRTKRIIMVNLIVGSIMIEDCWENN